MKEYRISDIKISVWFSEPTEEWIGEADFSIYVNNKIFTNDNLRYLSKEYEGAKNGVIAKINSTIMDSLDDIELNKNDLATKNTCHDCGVEEGQIHEFGCDMERCPFCGWQLISCYCAYKKLGFDFDINNERCGLSKDVYENGLNEELENKWLEILNSKGRVPYINYPVICNRCGELWPEMFMVSDEEWNYYIEPSQRNKVICKNCYNFIKKSIDEK